MGRRSQLSLCVGGCLASILLSSCNIRLPIDAKPIESPPVRKEISQIPEKKTDQVPVWLLADEFHTGMIFPYEWLLESGFIPPENFGKPLYVTMSWGNTDAYSQQGVGGLGKWTEVLLTPTPSVTELIPFNGKIVDVCPQQRIFERSTPRDRGPILADFLNKCSKTDSHGRPVVVRPSSWGNGVQLEGNYSYFIPRVCNVWTAQTIECIGGKIHPWFALTANGLIRQAQEPPNNFKQIWQGRSISHTKPSSQNTTGL